MKDYGRTGDNPWALSSEEGDEEKHEETQDEKSHQTSGSSLADSEIEQAEANPQGWPPIVETQ